MLFFVGEGGEGVARVRAQKDGQQVRVEEILDGGRGSTGTMESDSGGPSTFDMGVPRRREVYRIFSGRLFASRTADETCCGRRTVGTWTGTICVPACTRKDLPLAANPRSFFCSHKKCYMRTSQTAEI